MAHPRCGKCHSASVYKDYDEGGHPVIACLICGNRYPGNKEGFYMADIKDETNGKTDMDVAGSAKAHSENALVPARKMCKTCGEKPTISDSCPYCPSCMRKKSIDARQGKKAPVRGGKKGMEEDKGQGKKTPVIENTAVNIDFGKHTNLLQKVQALADQEIRPLNLQIVYLLKLHFETVKHL